MDRLVHPLRGVSDAIADQSSSRLAIGLQHPGPGRLGRLFLREEFVAQLDGESRLIHYLVRDLSGDADSDDRASADSHCPRNGGGDYAGLRPAARLAVESTIAE